MSRITDQWLKCAFYIYPSRPDAEAGRSIGGSGFFVSIGWADNQERRHVYAVTNKHVITSIRILGVRWQSSDQRQAPVSPELLRGAEVQKLGREGWELVSVYRRGDWIDYAFKRQAPIEINWCAAGDDEDGHA